MRCPNCGYDISNRAMSHHLAARGGSARTPAKQMAARANGRLGGRPPKKGVKPLEQRDDHQPDRGVLAGDRHRAGAALRGVARPV